MAGVVYAIIGVIVIFAGCKGIDILLPPVVTGAVVAVIGLNLAAVAVGEANTSSFDTIMAIVTILAVAAIAVYAPGALRRLPVLLGGVIGYLIYLLLANGFGLGKAIDFSGVTSVAWVGLPNFSTPTFNGTAIGLISPVPIVLVAENPRPVNAVAGINGPSPRKYLGRAFLGDGLA